MNEHDVNTKWKPYNQSLIYLLHLWVKCFNVNLNKNKANSSFSSNKLTHCSTTLFTLMSESFNISIY